MNTQGKKKKYNKFETTHYELLPALICMVGFSPVSSPSAACYASARGDGAVWRDGEGLGRAQPGSTSLKMGQIFRASVRTTVGRHRE